MRPTTLKSGDVVTVQGVIHNYSATFIRRSPARGPVKAVNYFQAPRFAGLNGPDDKGLFEMSDYDVSRRCELKGVVK